MISAVIPLLVSSSRASDAGIFQTTTRIHHYTTSQRLRRKLGTFINYAVWESTKHYKDAFEKYTSPEGTVKAFKVS